MPKPAHPCRSWFYAYAVGHTAHTGYRCAIEVRDEAGNLYRRDSATLARVAYNDRVYLGRLMNDHHGKPQRWRMAPIRAGA